MATKPCSDCGKTMQVNAKSLPNPVCRPCRKASLIASRITCCTCGEPMNAYYCRDARSQPQGRATHTGCRTECPEGHEYTEANTRINYRGIRRCRICEREYRRKYVEDGRRPKMRGHKTWRTLRNKYRADCAAADLTCWICSYPIDYSLAWPDRVAFEADHIVGVKSRPDLALERSNLAPSHTACNRSRGATQTHSEAHHREEFLINQLEQARLEIETLSGRKVS